MRLQIICSLLLFCVYALSSHAFEEEACKVIQEKVCVDYGERIIDGYPTSQCWKYEQKAICASKEQNHCQIFEANRGCHEITGACLFETPLGSCKLFEKKFTCGSKFDENAEVKHVGTDFDILRDEKDLSACSEKDKSDNCEFVEEICAEGSETRNISGKDVYKDCWRWEKKYFCNDQNSSQIDECSHLQNNPDCKEISRECLYTNGKNQTCQHLEIQYQCSQQQIIKQQCNKQNYCIGDFCKAKQRAVHNDFGSSINYLNILAGMKSTELEGCKCSGNKATCTPNEIDGNSCKFFTGNNGVCRNHHGQFNCCSIKGILGKDLHMCNQSEQDLRQKRSASLCHHTGSWRKKTLGVINKKYESYCCFKSKLARIIQVQGRAQLGIGWGNKENPDCRALTLDELKRIDFTKIDFSELFLETSQKANSAIEAKKQLIAKKMKNFYSKQED